MKEIAKGASIETGIDLEDFCTNGEMLSMDGYLAFGKDYMVSVMTVRYKGGIYYFRVEDNRIAELRKLG